MTEREATEAALLGYHGVRLINGRLDHDVVADLADGTLKEFPAACGRMVPAVCWWDYPTPTISKYDPRSCVECREAREKEVWS